MSNTEKLLDEVENRRNDTEFLERLAKRHAEEPDLYDALGDKADKE